MNKLASATLIAAMAATSACDKSGKVQSQDQSYRADLIACEPPADGDLITDHNICGSEVTLTPEAMLRFRDTALCSLRSVGICPEVGESFRSKGEHRLYQEAAKRKGAIAAPPDISGHPKGTDFDVTSRSTAFAIEDCAMANGFRGGDYLPEDPKHFGSGRIALSRDDSGKPQFAQQPGRQRTRGFLEAARVGLAKFMRGAHGRERK